MRGWTVAGRFLAAAVVIAGHQAAVLRPAAGHWTDGRYAVSAWSYNEASIRQYAGQAGIDSLYAVDWEWEVEDGRKWADPYADNATTARVVKFTYDNFDGMYGVYARANKGCSSSATCFIHLDLSERWNTTWEQRDSSWVDMRSVLLHELGHWMGAAHSYDQPAPDTRVPVMRGMEYGGLPYGTIRRAVTLDDIQALHAARNYATIITADDSFEYYGLYHFVERVAPGGGYHFRTDGNGYGGSRSYYRYWGAGSSVYQELAPRGAYMTNRDVRGRARFRNASGQPGTVTVSVWNMETSPPSVVQQGVCNLPLDTSWIQCATPYFRYDGRLFRLEAYNNNTGSVDVDTVIFG